MDILIVGGGIGGLTLALSLHQAGLRCRVLEAAPEIRPLGVGVNLLPHAMRELTELGLQPAVAAVAVETSEAAFFTRTGEPIYREPLGRGAGYDWPQFSVHRGDLHLILLRAVEERLGAEAIRLGHRCIGLEQDGGEAVARFEGLPPVRGALAVGCDGIHSLVRRQLYPDEGPPKYSGVNMWRGVTVHRPILTGASMIRAGWLTTGKLVIYPIRNAVDAAGNQLVNWVAEIERPQPDHRNWSQPGRLEDFLPAFAGWRFDWCDVPALLRGAEAIWEYPMVDQDPLPRWSFDRITLLGDAAHPMYPRGSNGAGQAILDARWLAAQCKAMGPTPAALAAYDAIRNPATAQVVLMNRTNPPDAILREAHERTGVSHQELAAISERYKQAAGYDIKALRERPPLV